jgi:Sigma-70 region 2/Kelch motif
LIANARRGDSGAFEELVRRHQDVAFRTAFLILRDAAEADDAAQEAIVKAYRAIRHRPVGEVNHAKHRNQHHDAPHIDTRRALRFLRRRTTATLPAPQVNSRAHRRQVVRPYQREAAGRWSSRSVAAVSRLRRARTTGRSGSPGSAWEKLGIAAWSRRKGAAVIVYQGKLWLFGGATHVQSDFTADQLSNDVWTSADGLNWAQVTGAAPWSPVDEPKVVVLNDALYLVGADGRADVWRSTDGKNWTQTTVEAPWTARHGCAAIVFDGKMWVYGGYIGKSTNAVNDVWYSSDGATWVEQAEHAPWGPRDPLSVVFQDKLWIFSGKHTGR